MTRYKYAPSRQSREKNETPRGNPESTTDRREYMFPPIPAFHILPARFNSFKEIPEYN
jgi:hypothetical protein